MSGVFGKQATAEKTRGRTRKVALCALAIAAAVVAVVVGAKALGGPDLIAYASTALQGDDETIEYAATREPVPEAASPVERPIGPTALGASATDGQVDRLVPSDGSTLRSAEPDSGAPADGGAQGAVAEGDFLNVADALGLDGWSAPGLLSNAAGPLGFATALSEDEGQLSVTVPASMPCAVAADGTVTAPVQRIENTGTVDAVVASITVSNSEDAAAIASDPAVVTWSVAHGDGSWTIGAENPQADCGIEVAAQQAEDLQWGCDLGGSSIIDASGAKTFATVTYTIEAAAEPAYATLYANGNMIFTQGLPTQEQNLDWGGAEDAVPSGQWTGFDRILPDSTSDIPWYSSRSKILHVNSVEEIAPKSTAYWFYNCANLQDADLTVFDASGVQSMKYMFRACSSLESVTGIGGWDTSGVKDMQGLFYETGELSSIGDLSGWNTANVTDMGWLIYKAPKLEDVGDISQWDVSKVENLKSAFNGDAFCKNLDLSGWRPAALENMSYMFYLSGFETIDLTGWTTPSLTDMSYLFRENASLVEVKGLDGFDTSSVTTLKCFTYLNPELSSLGDLSAWDVSKVTDLGWLFYEVPKLAMPGDLSGWSTPNVTNLKSAFVGASFADLDISGWTSPKCTDMSFMFKDMESLGTLDVSGLSTARATGSSAMSSMFSNLPNLWKVSFGDSFRFRYTNSLLPTPDPDYIEGADGLWYAESDGESYTPSQIPANTADTYYASKALAPRPTVWATLYGNGALVVTTGAPDSVQADVYGDGTEPVAQWSGFQEEVWSSPDEVAWRDRASEVTEAVVAERIDVEAMAYWFSGMESLAHVDLSVVETSGMQSTAGMFDGCDALSKVAVGEGFAFADDALLPVPGDSSVPDADGLWHAESDGGAYAPALVPDNKADTYYASAQAASDDRVRATLYQTDAMIYTHGKPTVAEHFAYGDGGALRGQWDGFVDREYTRSTDVPWYSQRTHIDRIVAVDGIAPASLQYWFRDLYYLQSAELGKVDTAGIDSLLYVFKGCSDLDEVTGLDEWDTSAVTTALGAFSGCSSLASLDLTGWDTSLVATMEDMFYNCSALVSIAGLEGFDTSAVRSFDSTFYNCRKLASLDSVAGWNTGSATTLARTFYHCESIPRMDLSAWDVSDVTTLLSTFSGCYAATGFGDLSAWDVAKVATMESAFQDARAIASVPGIDKWQTSSLKTTASMFRGCTSLASPGDLSGWDMDQVVTTAYMFYGCTSAQALEGLSEWSTPSLENISYMFGGCAALAYPGDLTGWDTSSVTTMRGAFSGCESLQSVIGPSEWETTSLADADFMFDGCSALATPGDLSGWDTSVLKDAESMFAGCAAMADASFAEPWDTSLLEDSKSMFSGCTALASLDLTGWDTGRLADASGMFEGCTALAELLVSGWDTEDLATADRFIRNCSALPEIDFTGWDTWNLESADGFFDGCTDLAKVTVEERWVFYPEGLLPVPSASFIEGADGLWHAASDGSVYLPADVPNTRADTYTAVPVPGSGGDDNNPYAYATLYGDGTFLMTRGTPTASQLEEYGVTDNTVVGQWTGFEDAHYESPEQVPWYGYDSKMKRAIVAEAISPTSTAWWFAGSVKEEDYNYISLSALETVDLRNLDTSGTTSMQGMFSSCGVLSEVDCTGFDTSNVTDFSHMFDCSAVASIPGLEDFDTSKAANMYYMLFNCKNLRYLDISGWSFESLEQGYSMFESLYNLRSVTVGEEFQIKGGMRLPQERFDGLWHSQSTGAAYGPDEIPDFTADTYWSIDPDCIVLTDLYNGTEIFTKGWPTDEQLLEYGGEAALYASPNDVWDESEEAPRRYSSNLRSVVAEPMAPASTAGWFKDCWNLETVDLTLLEITPDTDTTDMFEGCDALSEVVVGDGFAFHPEGLLPDPSSYYPSDGLWHAASDWTGYAPGEIPSYKADRYYADRIEAPEQGPAFATLYANGTLLYTVNAPTFEQAKLYGGETSQVVGQWTGFEDDLFATAEDAPWHASAQRVERAVVADEFAPYSTAYWFSGMELLRSADIAKLDVRYVFDASGMFEGCSSFEGIEAPADPATEPYAFRSLANAYAMFKGCTSMRTLPSYGYFELVQYQYAYKADSMYEGCTSLESAYVYYLADFDVADMFKGCTSLESVVFDGADYWSWTGGYKPNDIFSGCVRLSEIEFRNRANLTMIMPTPDPTYIEGADGYWYDSVEKEAHDPSGIEVSQEYGSTVTYYASSALFPDEGPAYATLYENGSMVFTVNEPTADQAERYGGSADAKPLGQWTGFEDRTYTFASVPWASQRNNVERVFADEAFAPSNVSYWFSGMGSLATAEVGKLAVDDYTGTSSGPRMKNVFSNCSCLEEIDIRGWRITNTLESDDFATGCPNLKKVTIGDDTHLYNFADAPSADNIEGADGLWHWERNGAGYDAPIFEGTWYASRNLLPSSNPDLHATLYANGTMLFTDGGTTAGQDMVYGESSGIVGQWDGFGGVVAANADELPWHGRASEVKRAVVCDEIAPASTARWFAGMENLEKADVSKISTVGGTVTTDMFDECSRLEEVRIGTRFEFSADGLLPTPDRNVILGADGKWYAESDGVGYTPEAVPDRRAETYHAASKDTDYATLYDNGTLLFTAGAPTAEQAAACGNGNVVGQWASFDDLSYDAVGDVPWDARRSEVTRIAFNESLSPADTSYWFAGMEKLREADIANLDTSGTVRADWMFLGCTNLREIDLSAWRSASMASCDGMFSGCARLAKVSLGEGADVGSALPQQEDAYISGADGKWHDETGFSYLPAEIPAYAAATYFANDPNAIYGTFYANGTLVITVGYATEEQAERYGGSADAVALGVYQAPKYDPDNGTRYAYPLWNMHPYTTAVVAESMSPDSVSNWFGGAYYLKTADLTLLDTSSTVLSGGLFGETYSLSCVSVGESFEFRDDMSFHGPNGTYGTEAVWYAQSDGSAHPADQMPSFKADTYWSSLSLIPGKDGIYATLYTNGTLLFSDGEPTDDAASSVGGSKETIVGQWSGFSDAKFSSSDDQPWRDYAGRVTRAAFSGSVAPKYTAHWFEGMTALSTLFGAPNEYEDGLRMWNVESADGMFAGCSSLASFAIMNMENGPDAILVNSLESAVGMFEDCTSLQSIESISYWRIGNLKDASRMFAGCSSLERLNLSRWDTGRLERADGMFEGCGSLRELVMNNWDTRNCASATGIFDGCVKLSKVNVGEMTTIQRLLPKQDAESVEGADGLWHALDGSGSYEPADLPLNKAAAYTAVASDTPEQGDITATLYGNGTLMLTDGAPTAEQASTTSEGVPAVASWTGFSDEKWSDPDDAVWRNQREAVKRVVVPERIAPRNMAFWFYGMTNLVDVDVSNIETSMTESLDGIFCGCSSMMILDISSWDTSRYTDLMPPDELYYNGYATRQFADCDSLARLVLGPSTTIGLNVDGPETWEAEDTHEELQYAGRELSGPTAFWQSSGRTPSGTYSTTLLVILYENGSMTVDYEVPSKADHIQYGDGTSIIAAWTSLTTPTRLSSPDDAPWADYRSMVTSLKVSTDGKRTIDHYFSGMENLRDIDITYVSNTARELSNAFKGCESIRRIQVGPTFAGLSSGAIPDPDPSIIEGADGLWHDASGNSYALADLPKNTGATYWAAPGDSAGESAYATLYGDGTLLFTRGLPEGNTVEDGVDPTGGIAAQWTGFESIAVAGSSDVPWHGSAAQVKRVSVVDEISPVDLSYWFAGMENLEGADVAGLNTMRVSDMNSVFSGCKSLRSVDGLESWDSANVTTMERMFMGCSSLESVTGAKGWVTNKVESMESLFEGCTALEEVDLSGWSFCVEENQSYGFTRIDTVDLTKMFSGCESLIEFDSLAGKNIYVNEMDHMFDGCASLRSVDITGTSNVYAYVNADYMFSGCTDLAELKGLEDCTWCIRGAERMFESCSSLTRIDMSVCNMQDENPYYMFDGCSSLQSLDLSGWNVELGRVYDMFPYPNKLERITIGTGFSSLYPVFPSTYIDGSDGKWYSATTGIGYRYNEIPYGTADTYLAVSPNVSCATLFNNDVMVLTQGEPTAEQSARYGNDSGVRYQWKGIESSGALWRDHAWAIKEVHVLEPIAPTTTERWFEDTYELTYVDARLLDMSDVTDMDYMFDGSGVSEIEGAADWDTGKVRYMSYTFRDCGNLVLDASGWNVQSVTSHASFNSYASGVTPPTWTRSLMQSPLYTTPSGSDQSDEQQSEDASDESGTTFSTRGASEKSSGKTMFATKER